MKTYGLTRDPSISGVLPTPGQLVAADLVGGTVSFASDGVYAASWRNSAGVVVAAARVRGMTDRRLAVVVPLGLSAGDYKLEFPLGDGRAELTVPVGAGVAVGDAVAVVTAARSYWGAQHDALQVTANADPDADRRGQSTADLARLSGWLTTFDDAVAGLDAASLRTLAVLLQANAGMRAAESSEPYPSVDGVAAQSAAAASLAEDGLAALAASGSVPVPSGSSAVLEALLSATEQIDGLVAVLTAYDRWTKAILRPCKPLDGTLQVTAADGSAMRLRFAEPRTLRCRVVCSSLLGSDGEDPRVANIIAALGAAGARRGSLLPSVGLGIGSQAPLMPVNPTVEVTELASSRLTLVSQASASGLPELILAEGALRADQVGCLSGTVQVVLRIAEAQLGTAGGTFGVTVDNSPPPSLDMVVIQPGTFQMGSEAVGPPAVPLHLVTITQPFWMGKYEVTQLQYQSVMLRNPSFFQGGTLPVDSVEWFDAVSYCDALSALEAAAGRLPWGYVYRLPTEAEWEYCCRAGTTTEWNVGSSLICGQANFYVGGLCVGRTSLVGSYAANAWGLHDMHGNVWEWCLDSWDGSDYLAGSVSDPLGRSGPGRVFRGGSWGSDPDNCRSAVRFFDNPTSTSMSGGFRVVCAPTRQ